MSADGGDRQGRLHRGVLAGAVVVGCGILYVALFALLLIEDQFIESRWYKAVPGGEDVLEAVFKPLLWLYERL